MVYNRLLRALFDQRFRDVSTGLRLARKSLIDRLDLDADSPFIGAEIAVKTSLKGYRVGEVGIQTFPRQFGTGSSTSPQNIVRTIIDMVQCYRRVFSADYELPPEGPHAPGSFLAGRLDHAAHAMTLRQRISSAPSKIDSTRASTK